MIPRRRADGFVTVQSVAAAGLALVLVVFVTELLVIAYAGGAVRAALDEGVRAGARSPTATTTCVLRAHAVLDDLLGGPLGRGVEPVACAAHPDRVRATTRATFPSWLPGLPARVLEASAVALREPTEETSR